MLQISFLLINYDEQSWLQEYCIIVKIIIDS
jgi:hypothetical protein